MITDELASDVSCTERSALLEVIHQESLEQRKHEKVTSFNPIRMYCVIMSYVVSGSSGRSLEPCRIASAPEC